MDEKLALECGAQIYGSIADIYVNADGYKKSIPGPGIGNYITVGKALGLARSIVGEDAVSNRSFIHAHGTGTPQNRVTESHILSEMAKAFKIEKWPVAAIKAYLGHTLAPASGDQITSALGTWQEGWIPGIATIDHIADDVYGDNLRLDPTHLEVGPDSMDVAFVNSKGFGGNNATGIVLSPMVTARMLKSRYGKGTMAEHAKRNESVREAVHDYDRRATYEGIPSIYKFGEQVLNGNDLTYDLRSIQVPGYGKSIDLMQPNPYSDMQPYDSE
jgi:acetoacetyl-[acyl-carrier protein] synthase